MSDAVTPPPPETTRPSGKPAPWRGRRMVADPKGRFIAVRCTDAEHAALTAKAATAGLSVGAYIRSVGLGSAGPRARRRPPIEREAIALLLGQVGRVGSNVNQLAKAMNTHGNLLAWGELTRAIDDIAAIRAELMRALGKDVPDPLPVLAAGAPGNGLPHGD